MESSSHVKIFQTIVWSSDFRFTTQGLWNFNITESNNEHSDTHVYHHQMTSNETEGTETFLPCNHPDNLIDEATADIFERLLHVIIYPLFEVFGIIANVINGVVFAKQGLKDRINLCLFSLAMADITFLVFVFAGAFYSFLGLFDAELEEYWLQRFMNTVLGPLLGALNMSQIMTVIIAVERCVCVLSPFTAKRFLKTRSMAVLIVSLSIYVMTFYSLLNMKYVTLQVTNSATNRTEWTSHLSAFYLNNRVVIDILYNHLLALCIPCVSLVVVIVTTSITVHHLRASLSWRKQTANKATSGDRREAAVTKMLTVVCLVHVSTMTPALIQVFFRSFVPGLLPTGTLCNTFRVVQPLGHLCEVINSSVNFIIYFSMGSRFRDTVRQMFSIESNYKSNTESLQTISKSGTSMAGTDMTKSFDITSAETSLAN